MINFNNFYYFISKNKLLIKLINYIPDRINEKKKYLKKKLENGTLFMKKFL